MTETIADRLGLAGGEGFYADQHLMLDAKDYIENLESKINRLQATINESNRKIKGKQMTYYEALAEVIFNHDNETLIDVAPWDKQSDNIKEPYIRAAQVATITLKQHNTFTVSMDCREPDENEGHTK